MEGLNLLVMSAYAPIICILSQNSIFDIIFSMIHSKGKR